MKPTSNLTRFNPDQAHALDAKRNLAVRANAGSGKTSVLLERIVQLLARGTGLEIDNLAAVTFTRKAAAQLREKLAEAFTELAGQAESPAEHAFWTRQIERLPRASIGTIDSFCARILRDYGPGDNDPIDPGFELMSEHEHDALRRQAVDRLINRLGTLPADRVDGRDRQHQEDMLWWAREEGYFALTAHLVELLGHGVEPAIIVAAHRDPRPIQERVAAAQRHMPHKARLRRDREVLRAQLLALQAAIAERDDSNDTLTELAEMIRSVAADLQEASPDADERVFEFLATKLIRKDGTPRIQGLKSVIEFVSPIHHTWVPLLKEADFDWAGEARALEAADRLARLLEPAHAEYLALCRETGQYDFVTVARRARDLLAVDAHARGQLRRRCRYIFVDEFQDTNQLQWEVLSYLVGDGPQGPLDRDRLFIVGDPQQSIYRFRQADVSVFQRLQDLIMQSNQAHGSADLPTDYDEHAGSSSVAEQRLGLMRLPVNYRTLSPTPLQLVDRVMEHAFGQAPAPCLPFEVQYQKLESDRPTTAGGEVRYVAPDGQAEILVEGGDDAGGDNGSDAPRDIPLGQLQVQCVVDQLIGLHGQPRWRPGENESATLTFGDMAILLPSRDVVLANLEKELSCRNVPYIVTKGVGFWQRQEVRDVVSLASFLADPGDGLSLFAVLRGPVGRLTDTEIFFLSQLGRGDIYRGLRLAALAGEELVAVPAPPGNEETAPAADGNDDDPWHKHPPEMIEALRDAWQGLGERRQRLRLVYEQFAGWRRRVERMAHSDLLQRSLEESDALAIFAAEPGGEQILANLRKLFELIRDEESRSSPGLVRLARWLREQVEVSLREEQAALPENRDAVRIMTIHAAKGLEFPVVAVMKMERKARGSNNDRLLVKSPLDQLLPTDAEEFAGIPPGALALAVRHPDRPRETYTCRLLKALRRLECAQDLAESRRLFYVAATRAKERLILAGMQGKNHESWQSWFDEALGIEPRHKELGLWEDRDHCVRIITRRPEDMTPVPAPPLGKLTDDVALAAIREAPREPMLATTALEKMLQAWRADRRDAWMAHRVQVAPHLPALPEHFPDDAADALKERVATSIGTLVHRLFEMREVLRESPRERSEFLRAMAGNLLAAASGEVGFDNETEATPAAVERVVAGVEGILKKLASRDPGALKVRNLLEADGEAEVDFALQVERWHISGRYDKLLQCGGGFEIVDWKSDADPSPAVIVDRHRPQMRLYALALYRAGQHVLVEGAVRVHLAMLHFPRVQTLSFTIDELESHAAHLARELKELETFSPGVEAAW